MEVIYLPIRTIENQIVSFAVFDQMSKCLSLKWKKRERARDKLKYQKTISTTWILLSNRQDMIERINLVSKDRLVNQRNGWKFLLFLFIVLHQIFNRAQKNE